MYLCQNLGKAHIFGIELLLVRHGIVQVDGDDVAAMEAKDDVRKTRENRQSRLLAKLARLHAVDDGRRTAALNMTENRNARLNIRVFGDEVADLYAKSSSGTRMYSAPPEMPLISASQPQCLPITSRTTTRRCAEAVSRSLLMASMIVFAAVSLPIV